MKPKEKTNYLNVVSTK